MPIDVMVGLGSNLGDSNRLLREAWRTLGARDGIDLLELSSPHLSSPVGMESRNWFTNAAGRLQTCLRPLELLDIMLDIEQHLGRVREPGAHGYQDRRIDLDLIYFGAQIIDEPRLVVPHPHRLARLFVLAPLNEIAPDFVDPQAGRTIGRLYGELLDRIATGESEAQQIRTGKWPEPPENEVGTD